MDNKSESAHNKEVNNAEYNKKNWYDRNYKLILIVPALILILSLAFIFSFYAKNGDIIHKDVSLTGGTTVTVFDSNIDINALKPALQKDFPDLIAGQMTDIRSGKQHGFFVETTAGAEKVKEALEKYLGYKLTSENSSTEFSGASLSSGFYSQLRLAIIIAFVLMSIVVFFIFRTFIPSLAVILAAFADIAMTLAVVDLIGVHLSGAGIIAFLMLIGYSVDTDILLTSRLLKNREGSVNERILGAFKTGITMTITAIAAVGVCLIIIYSFSDTLRQIFGIILIGLFFDILNTWVTNASMLKWYMGAKKIE